MDVRCENCGTEYELEDARLRPGGVTVKCTHCGHMFKVRRRAETDRRVVSKVPRTSSQGVETIPLPIISGSSEPMAAAIPGDRLQPHVRAHTESGPAARARPSPELRHPAHPSPMPHALEAVPTRRDRLSSGPTDRPGTSQAGKERLWLVMLPDGEIETCRELATLQQWIISGRVTRSSGISRTGNTWKALGEIAELSSFFDIADEAEQVRRERAASRVSPLPEPDVSSPSGPHGAIPGGYESHDHLDSGPTQPMGMIESSGRLPPPAVVEQPAPPEPSVPVPHGFHEGPGSAPHGRFPLPAEGIGRAHEELYEAPSELRAHDPNNPAESSPYTVPPAEHSPERIAPSQSGGWSGHLHNVEGSDPTGPVTGQARGTTSGEFAFTDGQPVVNNRADADRSARSVFADEEDDYNPARSSAARWIVVLSLFLMAGAAVVVYFMVFRQPVGDALLAAPGRDAAPVVQRVGPDAAVAAAPPAAKEVPEPRPPTPSTAEILADTYQHLLADDRNAIADAEAVLAGLDGADSDPEILVARARIHTALAQHLFDEVQAMGRGKESKRRRNQLNRTAQQRVLDAVTLTKKVRQKDSKNPAALVILADVSRLQNKRASEVERYVKKALKQDAANRDALLVRALSHLRHNRPRKARKLLERLASGAGDPIKTGDIRPLYRLALIDLADKNYRDARRRADAITAVKPDHPGAQGLIARIDAATAVNTDDPLPREEDSRSSRDESYDSILERAHRRAENGDCSGALDLYERAVDMQPTSVPALTGMGYCHVDRKEFASAHGKFKAALAVSPRYQEALWGIAEAYQQQGLKPQAIAAYKLFIEEHPNTPRADRARQHIEKLGGSASEPAGSKPTSGPSGPPSGNDRGGGSEQPSSTGASSEPGQPPPSNRDKAPDSSGTTGAGDEPAGSSPQPGSGDSHAGDDKSSSGTSPNQLPGSVSNP